MSGLVATEYRRNHHSGPTLHLPQKAAKQVRVYCFLLDLQPFTQNPVYSFQTQGNKPNQKGRIKSVPGADVGQVQQGVTGLCDRSKQMGQNPSCSALQVSALSQGGSGTAGCERDLTQSKMLELVKKPSRQSPGTIIMSKSHLERQPEADRLRDQQEVKTVTQRFNSVECTKTSFWEYKQNLSGPCVTKS